MIEIIPNGHPLLVHFPIALISVSAVFHLATSLLFKQARLAAQCAVLAHGTLWLAALSVLPTVLFGWLASNTVNHDEASHAAMLLHRNWALASALLMLILAAWDAKRHLVDALPKRGQVAVVLFAWGLVASTAWHGGELVYRHGLGVMSLPDIHAEQDAAQHDAGGHEHIHIH